MAGSRPRFQVASRSAGKSACAMAAYRSAEIIECETYGQTNDYTRKGGVLHSEIIAPDHAPEWVYDRAQLWNAVEQSELTKAGDIKVKAQLAREIIVPLPHELDLETNREALREWIAAEFVSRGMIADLNIHAPDKDGDQRNFHAHIMLTMREITPDGFNPEKLKSIARDWNKKHLLDQSIQRWQDIQNRELERAGLDVRADFSSLESRGIDREPEQHEGPTVTNMKRKNKDTRIGQENEARRDRNSDRASQHMKALHELVRLEEQRAKFAAWAAQKEEALESAQTKTMHQLQIEQASEAIDFEDRVQAAYAPSLLNVQMEANRMEAIVNGSGIIATARRMIRGKRDTAQLEALQMTIANTQQRMEEMRAKLDSQHRADRERLARLQTSRARQQAEGIRRSQERKEAAESASRTAAEATAQETAKKGFSLAEGLEKVRQSRAAWKQKQEENKQAAHANEQRKESATRRAEKKRAKDTKTTKQRPIKPRSKWLADKERAAADQAARYEGREATQRHAQEAETAAKQEALRPSYEARQEEIRRNLESIDKEIDRQESAAKDKGKDKGEGMEFEP